MYMFVSRWQNGCKGERKTFPQGLRSKAGNLTLFRSLYWSDKQTQAGPAILSQVSVGYRFESKASKWSPVAVAKRARLVPSKERDSRCRWTNRNMMDGQHLSRPLQQQGISQAEDPRRVGHLCLWVHPLAYTPGSQMASQWGPLSTQS